MKPIPLLTLTMVFAVVVNLTAQGTSDWPKNIDELKTAICVVEYFQPQFEMGEIKDQSRIKRKITGILANKKGLVVTSDVIYPVNLDIVEATNFYVSTQPLPEDITVSFERDKKLKAKFLGKDEDLRLAFIQIIEEAELPEPVIFSENDKESIGDPILIIQHLNQRFDFEKIVTSQHINAIIEKPKKKLLTTTNINPLSPGGLVLNWQGQAIGIVFRGDNHYLHYDYEYEPAYSNESLVQIISTAQFMPLIQDPPIMLTQNAGSGKSWLGIQMQVMTKEMAAYWNLGDASGVIINKVSQGSPAEKAGLQAGDILLSIADLKFQAYDKKNLDILRNYVRNLPEGNVSAEILRNKKPRTISIRLESAPKSRFLAEEYPDKLLGIGVKELTQDYIITSDLDFNTEGVWVSRVEDAGPAGIAGIEVNDLVMHINGTTVKNLEDFRKVTTALPRSKDIYIEVFLNRRGKTRFIYIKTMPDEDES